MDRMLSLETGDEDALYRIRRADGRVVYVTVLGADFLPGHERNYGPAVLAELSKLSEWAETWTSLRVHVGSGGTVRCEVDPIPPPAVPAACLREDCPRFDLDRLTLVRTNMFRTSEVALDGQAYFLKIARFPHEIRYLAKEIQAYHRLAGTALAPKLAGYVYETSEDRVVGFLTEPAEGRFPERGDLEDCRAALDRLHQYLIHGDLIRYNMIITAQGPKFIDLETAVLVGSEKWSVRARDEEKAKLEEKLADESTAGCPW